MIFFRKKSQAANGPRPGVKVEELELKGKTNNWMCLSVISNDEEICENLESPRAGSIRGS